MASEARIAANRLNAQKSTGPRTAAGKAVVAQNAVKHGLLAREAVLRGEDREEYEEHREALLEELNPTGTLEVILATRIVDLAWRLQRAAQSQNETFGALYDRHTAGAPEPEEPAQRGAVLGRMLLEDYSGSGVLERLLRCERRIEGSLFRSLNELRRVHDQQCKADAETAATLACSSRGLRTGWREEDDRARKERAFAPWRAEGPAASPQGLPPSDFALPTGGGSGLVPWGESVRQAPTRTDEVGRGRPNYEETPGGATTSAPARQLCETNPIGPEANMSQVLSGTAVRIVSAPEGLRKTNPMGSAPGDTGILPVGLNHGRDAHATEMADRGGTDTPRGQLCETKPIGAEPNAGQVPCGTTVRSDSACEGVRKTNPMGRVPCGTGIPPVDPNHGRVHPFTGFRAGSEPVEEDGCHIHGQDARATHGRDAHAAAPPDIASAEPGGNGVNPAADQGRFATCKYAKTG
jgi:hypothetical protein